MRYVEMAGGREADERGSVRVGGWGVRVVRPLPTC